MPGDADNLIDLVVPGGCGPESGDAHDAVGQVDAVAALGKQVDGGGGAEQGKIRGVHTRLQRGVSPWQQDDDIDLAVRGTPQGFGQATQLDEQEAFGKGEVFLQVAVALKGSRGIGKERVLIREPPGDDE